MNLNENPLKTRNSKDYKFWEIQNEWCPRLSQLPKHKFDSWAHHEQSIGNKRFLWCHLFHSHQQRVQLKNRLKIFREFNSKVDYLCESLLTLQEETLIIQEYKEDPLSTESSLSLFLSKLESRFCRKQENCLLWDLLKGLLYFCCWLTEDRNEGHLDPICWDEWL